MYDFESLIREHKLKYVHGSEDSIDKDVYYVFDELPEFGKCREFCSDKEENRNIICVKNGIVSDCFIGTIDEVNNSLFDTYNLHEQEYPLIIEQKVPRDIIMKDIRATRGILSTISRTQYRNIVKDALRGSWSDRIDALGRIDFSQIDYDGIDKNHSGKDALKIIAFQLGQSIGLHEGIEFYTKSTISLFYKELEPFLYRKGGNLENINLYVDKLLYHMSKIEVKENDRLCTFEDGRIIDLSHENVVDNIQLER